MVTMTTTKLSVLLLSLAPFSANAAALREPKGDAAHDEEEDDLRSLKGGGKGGSKKKTALQAPPLPGIAQPSASGQHKILLAMDIDYPPYAYLGAAENDFPLAGFGPDVARGLTEVCPHLDMVLSETRWSNCWGSNEIGRGLSDGWFHGCMTYTHTAGVRNRSLEFSQPILDNIPPAGLLTRLDADGNPVVNGASDLSGITVVDVVGWAPTADTLAIAKNDCNGGALFQGYNMIAPTHNTGSANDDALLTLLDGTADAMWTYVAQAESYKCENVPDGDTPTYDCTLWDGLGTTFAYIHTGIVEHTRGGTTLSIAKKGSGVADLLNPCIDKFIQTESYYNICVAHDFQDVCFTNEYFPKGSGGATANSALFSTPTNELTTSCADGYCPCPAA